MKTNQLFSIVIAGVLAVGTAFAQQTESASGGCPMMCGVMCGKMGAHKGQMADWHQKMMEKIKAQDAEMDKLIQEMNAASGEKKVEALAAIANKAMEERKAWHAEMEMRHKTMMEWMKAGEKASPNPEPKKDNKSR